tara:strand:+ start:695 stop:1045 length:351 start_codon:yes stop_codon:yes gene_type:complete
MAIRYDQKKKDKVVAFIVDYNEKNGRGGQSAAAAKWSLNPITVKAWMEKAGVASPGKSGKKKSKAKGGVAKTVRRAGVSSKKVASSSISGVLKRMADIQDQLASLQGEYDSLKAKL